MIPSASQVWLVVEPIDMRAGIDGLSLRVQATLGRWVAVRVMAVPTPSPTVGATG